MFALIIQQLKQVYGHDMKVYDEPIQQGMVTPSFLVLLVDDDQERKLGNLSEWEYMFNITYFPHDKRNINAEMNQISESFKINFRYIGNRFHVHRLKASKSDGVLVGDKMQSLQFGGVFSE